MKRRIAKFYNPIYWPAWFLVGLIWLLIQLPYRFQLKLGKGLGLILLSVDTKLKRIAKRNIDLCFPELSSEQRQKLLRKNFQSIGIAIFETGLAWFGSKRRLSRLIHLHNTEYLERIKSNNVGILLLGIHFLSLEIIGRLFALDHDFVVIYRAHKKPFINFLISRLLKKHYKQAIERHNVRAILKALKEGQIVWYTPDIDAGFSNHLFILFFGIPAATSTAVVRLLKMSGAKAVPCCYYRREDGTGYDLIAIEELENFPSGDIRKDLVWINQIIEKAISFKPDQYIWQYKRFKTRPEGEDDLYI